MTGKEAEKIINECKDKGFKHTFYTLNEYHTALDMAAKALEQEVPDTNVGNIDCISREDAIHIASGGCHFSNVPKELKKLPSVNPQPRWIPVSERLPEEGEEVLVSGYDTYNKKVIIAKYQGEQYGFTCGLVSAWMPLPKPYESQESEG